MGRPLERMDKSEDLPQSERQPRGQGCHDDSVENQGYPDQFLKLVWDFYFQTCLNRERYLLLVPKETIMSEQEICYVKQAVLSSKDWDVYQSIVRKLFKMMAIDSKEVSV